MLGSTRAAVRIPLALLAAAACFYCFLNSQGSNWQISRLYLWPSVLAGQGLATLIVSLILRASGFRIEHLSREGEGPNSAGLSRQFSLRHLFYWTTAAALLVAIGRLLPLSALMQNFGSQLLIFTAIITLVCVFALWAALGREGAWTRLLLALLGFPLLGVAAAWGEYLTRNGSAWNPYSMMGYRITFQAQLIWWVSWTGLAGLLLAALVLSFRCSGQRLMRRPRQAASASPFGTDGAPRTRDGRGAPPASMGAPAD